DMLALINKGAIDTCLNLTDFVSTQSNISLAKLFDVPKYLVYSTKLIKKSTDSIVMTDFKNETFFCLGDASSDPTRPLMLEYCRHYHFCPAVKSLPNIESVMSNVEFGNGVTILDGLTQFNQSDQIRRLEMQPPHSLCLAWLNSCQNPLVPLLKKQLMTMGNFK
ncbi:MAG: hypothetical protein LIO58_05760, partial [Oscillospiraceae bacterium]|nr:hypothetical protein [Oscillospiraceae bacterium]